MGKLRHTGPMAKTGRTGIQVQAPEPTILQCYSASKGCTNLLGKKGSFRVEYLFLVQTVMQAWDQIRNRF